LKLLSREGITVPNTQAALWFAYSKAPDSAFARLQKSGESRGLFTAIPFLREPLGNDRRWPEFLQSVGVTTQ